MHIIIVTSFTNHLVVACKFVLVMVTPPFPLISSSDDEPPRMDLLHENTLIPTVVSSTSVAVQLIEISL